MWSKVIKQWLLCWRFIVVELWQFRCILLTRIRFVLSLANYKKQRASHSSVWFLFSFVYFKFIDNSCKLRLLNSRPLKIDTNAQKHSHIQLYQIIGHCNPNTKHMKRELRSAQNSFDNLFKFCYFTIHALRQNRNKSIIKVQYFMLAYMWIWVLLFHLPF